MGRRNPNNVLRKRRLQATKIKMREVEQARLAEMKAAAKPAKS